MRIIAGACRGRALIGPKDEAVTRPITDRVKETLFNKLFSLGLLGEGTVCDVFCGTGSLGLEALSRGAEHCLFIEQDRDALTKLKQNIDALGLGERARVKAGNGLGTLWVMGLAAESVRLAFLDPPYAVMHDEAGRGRIGEVIAALYEKLEAGGVVVLRSHKADAAVEAEEYDGPRTFIYGNMAVHLYQRPVEEDPQSREA